MLISKNSPHRETPAYDVNPHPGQAFSAFVPTLIGTKEIADRLGKDEDVDLLFRRITEEITAVEGPVHLERLTRLTYACFDLHRLVPMRTAWLHTVLPRHQLYPSKIGTFLWPEGIEPATWREFRKTCNPTDRRPTEISSEEMTNALVYALNSHPDGIEQDALAREGFGLLGHRRLTNQSYDRLVLALEQAVRERRALRRGMHFTPLFAEPTVEGTVQ